MSKKQKTPKPQKKNEQTVDIGSPRFLFLVFFCIAVLVAGYALVKPMGVQDAYLAICGPFTFLLLQHALSGK